MFFKLLCDVVEASSTLVRVGRSGERTRASVSVTYAGHAERQSQEIEVKSWDVFMFKKEGVLLQVPHRLSYEVRSATVAVAT